MIEVKYSCRVCGLHRIPVMIEPRDEEDDVVAWVSGPMSIALVADHERRSPGCQPSEFSEVMIPLPHDESGWIGGPEVH